MLGHSVDRRPTGLEPNFVTIYPNAAANAVLDGLDRHTYQAAGRASQEARHTFFRFIYSPDLVSASDPIGQQSFGGDQ